MPDVLRAMHPTVTPQRYAYDLRDLGRNALTREFPSVKAAFVRDGSALFQIESMSTFSNIARQSEREVFEDSWGNPGLELTAER